MSESSEAESTGGSQKNGGEVSKMPKLQLLLVAIMGVVFIGNIMVSLLHSHVPGSESGHNLAIHEAVAEFKRGISTTKIRKDTPSLVDGPSKIASLSCEAYGGPPQKHAEEMVYWSDIPSDAKYISPLKKKRGERRQYMTFEPGTFTLLTCCILDFLTTF